MPLVSLSYYSSIVALVLVLDDGCRMLPPDAYGCEEEVAVYRSYTVVIVIVQSPPLQSN